MKIIIIGGVAGGATTAARIRRVDETAEIILLEKGKYISYANCGLPYYIGGVIEERDKLFVQTPEAFSTRFRVDVRTENEAIFIDRKRKTVTIRQSSAETLFLQYVCYFFRYPSNSVVSSCILSVKGFVSFRFSNSRLCIES